MADDLDSQAAAVVQSLTAFRAAVLTNKPEAVGSLNTISHALDALNREFTLDAIDRRGRKRDLQFEEGQVEELKKAWVSPSILIRGQVLAQAATTRISRRGQIDRLVDR